MIATVKKWLSTFVTALLLLVLFGLIFVRLDLIELTTTFWLELGIVATLTCIVRFFWYNEGEDRAMHDQDIITLKTNYSKLVEDTIQSQEDLDTFVEKIYSGVHEFEYTPNNDGYDKLLIKEPSRYNPDDYIDVKATRNFFDSKGAVWVMNGNVFTIEKNELSEYQSKYGVEICKW